MPETRHLPLLQRGRRLLATLELIGLAIITLATLIAGAQELWRMALSGHVKLADLLLLFIYLEVLAMVAVYHQSGALPVRMPLYIAIIALARHMILDMKGMTEAQMLATAGGALILALAVLVLRFGHARFPYGEDASDE